MNAVWCPARRCWVCYYPGTRDVIAAEPSKIAAEDEALRRFRLEQARLS